MSPTEFVSSHIARGVMRACCWWFSWEPDDHVLAQRYTLTGLDPVIPLGMPLKSTARREVLSVVKAYPWFPGYAGQRQAQLAVVRNSTLLQGLWKKCRWPTPTDIQYHIDFLKRGPNS